MSQNNNNLIKNLHNLIAFVKNLASYYFYQYWLKDCHDKDQSIYYSQIYLNINL